MVIYKTSFNEITALHHDLPLWWLYPRYYNPYTIGLIKIGYDATLIALIIKLIDISNSLNPPSEYTIIKMSVDWEGLNAKLPYQKNEVKKNKTKWKVKKYFVIFLWNIWENPLFSECKNKTKELIPCHNLKLADAFIFATWWCKP